jgi:hypothetical protein
MCQEGAPTEVTNLRRILKVVEYLGGKTVQKRAQDRPESLRDSVRLYQEGIEQMHRMHQEKNSISNLERRQNH